jgi:hypothetical protein
MIARWRTVSAIGLTLAVLLAGAACSGSSRKTPTGTLADVGFRPSPNGFTFQNYGDTLSDGSTPTNLTADDVRTMFGDTVCVDARSGRCDLNPPAQAWLDSTNKEMAGGHCYGFSVTAELLWLRKVKATTYGAPDTPGLAIDDNTTLQRLIAYNWTLQLLDSVQSRRITGTPNQILANLRTVLKANPTETYTLAIWMRDGTGGHAVTPYEVDNKGGGKFDVSIYDNNWPDRPRSISFDTKANTWFYDAAVNPAQSDELYVGDAKTMSISLFPTSPGLAAQPCPFCAKVPVPRSKVSALEAHATEQISLLGSLTDRANLIVTDHAGHRLGAANGTMVDQIPGARFVPVISSTWTNKITPNFYVPANETYTLTLDGTALRATDTETVSVVGPSSDVSVSDITVHPGDKVSLAVAQNATKLSYTTSGAGSPTFQLGVSNNQAAYAFVVGGMSPQPGSTTTFGLPAEGGDLTLEQVGSARASAVNLKMTRYTKQGPQVYSHDDISLLGGDTAELRFGNWTTTGQTIPLVTTHNGKHSTQSLGDQANGAGGNPGGTGTTGPAGAPGPTGPPGSPGPAGAVGPSGPSGATGPSGSQGPAGPAGQAGSQGPAGAPGQSGSQGQAGAAGPTGPPGPTGATGPTGPQGQPGATGPRGPAGITTAGQGALVGGTVVVGVQPTLVVRTTPLPAGHYAVTADLTVAGSQSLDSEHRQVAEIDCWVTPDSAGISNNSDGVRIAADIGRATQTLSVNDLLTTTTSPDQVDLVCSVLPTIAMEAQPANVTHASILATGIAIASTTTTQG